MGVYHLLGYVLGTLFMAIVVLMASFIMGMIIGVKPGIVVAFLVFVFGSAYFLISRGDPIRNFQKIIIASIVVILFEITIIGAVTIFSAVGFEADLLVVLACLILIFEILKVEARVREIYEQAKACKLEEVEKVIPLEEKPKPKRRKLKHRSSLRDVIAKRRE